MGPIEVVARGRRGRSQAPACRRLLTRLVREIPSGGAGVTLLLESDAAIRKLNRRYRGRDAVTAVLSFPSSGDLEPGRPHLGEIAIAVPRAERQARRARWSLRCEMALLVTHGFLHLLGYDHDRDDGEMRRLEEDLLRRAARVSLARRRLPWGEDPPAHGRRRSGAGRRFHG